MESHSLQIEIGHLQVGSSLEELGLNDTDVTDAGLVHLRSLHELTALGLARTRITNQGLPEVQRLPKLQVLQLQGTAAGASDASRLTDRSTMPAPQRLKE